MWLGSRNMPQRGRVWKGCPVLVEWNTPELIDALICIHLNEVHFSVGKISLNAWIRVFYCMIGFCSPMGRIKAAMSTKKSLWFAHATLQFPKFASALDFIMEHDQKWYYKIYYHHCYQNDQSFLLCSACWFFHQHYPNILLPHHALGSKNRTFTSLITFISYHRCDDADGKQ